MATTALADRAIRWYAVHARDLPWRRPGTTPWGVLVSEVMLQQTPVARVIPAWSAWQARWPTPADLAAAPAGEAIRAWGRLGYPRRALRLHECARALVADHAGAVPADLSALLALPGIGAYTARAVATFAFAQRHPVVDTNVRRLIARACGGRSDGGAATTVADMAAVVALLPRAPDRAARASVAFMELGALVCTAREPSCEDCPLRTVCAWRAAGQPAATGPARRSQRYTGTDRQVRGLILALARDAEAPVTTGEIAAVWPDAVQRERALRGLLDDGLVRKLDADRYDLPGI
jgi:A/G-specific adenine glycosylase